MNPTCRWFAILFLAMASTARAAPTVEATALTYGSITINEISNAGPDFRVQFSPVPSVINNFVDLTGAATGSNGGFATHNAADPDNAQPGDSISWRTEAMATVGPGVGSAEVGFDTSGQILFVNPGSTAVSVVVQMDYFVTSDATIDSALGTGWNFVDFQFNANLPLEAFFVDFGETLSDTRLFNIDVPAAGQGLNGVFAISYFSGSFLNLESEAAPVASVPEPGSLVLVLAALAGMVLIGRRRMARHFRLASARSYAATA